MPVRLARPAVLDRPAGIVAAEGVTFLFGDRHVDFLRDSIDLSCLQTFITIAGGEVVQIVAD